MCLRETSPLPPNLVIHPFILKTGALPSLLRVRVSVRVRVGVRVGVRVVVRIRMLTSIINSRLADGGVGNIGRI